MYVNYDKTTHSMTNIVTKILNTLVQAEREIEKEAEKYLEMPAVMEERQDSNVVLEKRPDLEGYSECNIVFTDISQSTTSRVLMHASCLSRRLKSPDNNLSMLSSMYILKIISLHDSFLLWKICAC